MLNLQNKKNLIIKILVVKLLFLSFVFLGGQKVLARPTFRDALENVGTVATDAGVVDKASVGDKALVGEVVSNVITAVLSTVGVLFFILIVYGGFNWMMARGNDEQIKKSKNTVKAAVIGLAVILGAYAITAFVGNIL